ncbi:TIGR01777 family oxidoreductase [Limisalsivibrio acetivorans]|uniref:TIGR01777 family oxidoreductase n=1 Tax=Limisalsivibrio acetivorans TaxID=1304888 RepID=UPI0003B68CBC|nr:TIGR01777 family oxidoreductase [Limisalsivibrio acetivorans]
MPLFTFKSDFDAPVKDLFDWHKREGALLRLVPPWESVEMVEKKGGIAEGSSAVFKVKIGPFSKEWKAVHTAYEENRMFRDRMEYGPFKSWEHTHLFEEKGDKSSLEERIEFKLPFNTIAYPFAAPFVKKKLASMFRYRHRVTAGDLQILKKYKPEPMNIVVSGAGGEVGRYLVPFLTTQGHSLKRLVRKEVSSPDEEYWNPIQCRLGDCFPGMDAVIHLAGEPIGRGKWDTAKKKIILESRIEGTRLIAERLASMDNPPKTFITASAIGYYGDRGEEDITEDSPAGEGFIADVCREWEKAAEPAIDKGIRVVFLRIGVALSPSGGALERFLPFYRMGIGAVPGNGEQYLSWISMDDLLGSIAHALYNKDVTGAVNAVSPEPLTMNDFARKFLSVTGFGRRFTIPAPLIRHVFGEMGEEVLLSGAKVYPEKMLDTGYEFRYPHLESALRHLLGKREG